MKIDISTLDKERFNVEERQHPEFGTLHVITPDKAMFDWNLDELHLRSVVVRNGEVISAGFPKFFNYSEMKTLDAIVDSALADYGHPLHFTWKVDGSLIIRAVVDGRVYLRTRGSHELGPFEEPVMRLIREKHPKILDPSIAPEFNLLFEYTAPDNQIVLRYDEPKLTALAYTSFDAAGHLGVWQFHARWAEEFGVDTLEFLDRMDSIEVIKSTLNQLKKKEGFVTWVLKISEWGGYHLTKFKTDWYMKIHALRSQASPRFIKEYCIRHDLMTLPQFQEQLAKDGFDWEVVSYLEPSFQAFATRWSEIESIVGTFDIRCAELGLDKAPDRKTLAMTLKSLATEFGHEWLFHYGIMYHTGKHDSADEFFSAQVLDCGVNEFRNLKQQWAAEATPT